MKSKILPNAIEYWDDILPHFNDWGYEYGATVYDDYIQLIKQPLQLWMFIPCKDGVPLEKPYDYEHWLARMQIKSGGDDWNPFFVEKCKEYQQAEAKTIFTEFELFEDTMFNHSQCVIRKRDGFIINLEGKIISDLANKVKIKSEICEKLKI